MKKCKVLILTSFSKIEVYDGYCLNEAVSITKINGEWLSIDIKSGLSISRGKTQKICIAKFEELKEAYNNVLNGNKYPIYVNRFEKIKKEMNLCELSL